MLSKNAKHTTQHNIFVDIAGVAVSLYQLEIYMYDEWSINKNKFSYRKKEDRLKRKCERTQMALFIESDSKTFFLSKLIDRKFGNTNTHIGIYICAMFCRQQQTKVRILVYYGVWRCIAKNERMDD